MAFDPDVDRKCREYIRDRLEEVLPKKDINIRSHQIVIRKFPWNDGKIHPGITIHPLEETLGRGTCATDDIGYGVGVTFVESTGDGLRTEIDRTGVFRSHVRGEFHNKKIPVASVFICTVEFGDFLLPKQYRGDYNVSTLLVRCWNEDERK